MSDSNESEPRMSRLGPSVALGGLAAGAILGATLATQPTPASAAPPAATSQAALSAASGADVAVGTLSVQDQFREAFTAGAVATETANELMPVVCPP
jgi:hypothetical protein